MKHFKSQKTPLQIFLEQNFGNPEQKRRILHCTNPKCKNFYHDDIHDTGWRRDHGYYDTRAFGAVRRYICLHCGKTFSDQSFSLDYYAKKRIDYFPLLKALVSTSGQGNLSRFAGLRYELIQNRYERLCRMLLALHSELRKQITPDEDFVYDGFESFSMSQYYPNNVNIVSGNDSEFIYGMGFSQLRRKGRMSRKQKEKRKMLEDLYGRADPKAIELSTASLICNLGKLLHYKDLDKRTLYTDEHKAYKRAVKRIIDFPKYFNHVQHSSRAVRNKTNPLFAVNYIDRQIRKDQVNHVRESIQFARCPAAMMARLSIYQVYHNYMMPKRVREQRKGNCQTRGEFLGLKKERVLIELNKVWGKRIFINKTDLWEEEKKTWLMQWQNSNIRSNKRIPFYIED